MNWQNGQKRNKKTKDNIQFDGRKCYKIITNVVFHKKSDFIDIKKALRDNFLWLEEISHYNLKERFLCRIFI